jgi:transcriptional regulator with XRE-family HTH domain
MANPKSPTQLDEAIGQRLRSRRRSVGLTERALALAIDVKHQQIQRFEKAELRIKPEELAGLARVLDVPVGYFFEPLPDPLPSEVAEDQLLRQFVTSDEGQDLNRAYHRLRGQQLRKAFLDLVKSIAGSEETITSDMVQ